jgi:Niemann-Pick C1 protein
MSRLNLSFDYITCVALQMAVGLSVDYAVHVGYTFLTIQSGTKTERTINSIMDVGPTVFHGGVSTLLMFGALATIDAYVALAFIKVCVYFQ